ncbi:Glutaminase 1 [Baekduia alba]|uniref:glutaminase A n=1 Tax=Baekduia alba TaxID=2997333 RepID=UPI0023413659|nr:glutaminase A [Baekduia alba]WCB96313.1 Glutaminase 1 [Baekduia alba]
MPDDPYISTGSLPPAADVQALLDEAHARFAGIADGETSDVYPALAVVPPDLFGIAVASTDRTVLTTGDAQHAFTIMSVAKPFVFALVCDRLGADLLRDRIGVNGTGLPFNSLAAVEHSADGRTNPMVNAGAIATTSLVPGATVAERWAFVRDGLSAFAGRALDLDEEILASARATNARNQGLARLLQSYGRLYADPAEAVDLYTGQSALSVTARDLAVMGATLADGGVNPVTGRRVVDAATCHATLAVMVTAGLYETSGDWFYDVGLPAKSGIGGGLVTVSPGKGGMGTFAPRLDAAGNSVRGALVARHLSARLGTDLLLSAPDR